VGWRTTISVAAEFENGGVGVGGAVGGRLFSLRPLFVLRQSKNNSRSACPTRSATAGLCCSCWWLRGKGPRSKPITLGATSPASSRRSASAAARKTSIVAGVVVLTEEVLSVV
jgi:hypothetical protein